MAGLGENTVDQSVDPHTDGIMAGHGFQAVGRWAKPLAIEALDLHHVTVFQNYKMGSNVDAAWYLDHADSEKYFVAVMRLPTGNKFYKLTSFDVEDGVHPFMREMSMNAVKAPADHTASQALLRILPNGAIVERRKHWDGPAN